MFLFIVVSAKTHKIATLFLIESIQTGQLSVSEECPEMSATNSGLSRIDEIIENRLYICAAKHVTPENVGALSISHIVNCTISVPLYKHDGIKKTVRFGIADTEKQNIVSYFDKFIQFVTDAIQDADGRVLVHCHQGVSRSSTLIIAYVMKSMQLNLARAFTYVVDRHRITLPNRGFFDQLREYDKQLYGTHSVEWLTRPLYTVPDIVIEQSSAYRLYYLVSTCHKSKKERQNREQSDEAPIEQ